MYANHYTNIPLNKILKNHRKNQPCGMTIFLHNNTSNDINTSIYTLKDRKLINYQKTNNHQFSSDNIFDKLRENKSLEIRTYFSSPTIAVIFNTVSLCFESNFDFKSIKYFLIGMLANQPVDLNVRVYFESDIKQTDKIFHFVEEILTEYYDYITSKTSVITKITYEVMNPENYYSIEINTLYDYFKMNADVGKNPFWIFSLQNSPDYIKGNLKDSISIENCFIGERSYIAGNLKNCIVWDNCNVDEDCEGHIFFASGRSYSSVYHDAELNISWIYLNTI